METIRLNSGCYIASDISDESVLVIGGGAKGKESKITPDFKNLSGLYTKIEHNFSANNLDEMGSFFRKNGFGDNAEIYAEICLLQRCIEKNLWQNVRHDDKSRMDFYQSKDIVKLSEAVESKQLACSDLSLLAYKALKDRGLNVNFISGSFVEGSIPEGQDEYSEAHSFLTVENPKTGDILIYDPANPLIESNGHFATFATVPKNEFLHWQKEAVSKIAYMKVREEVTNETRYYGASPPNCVFWSDKHVVKTQEQNTATPMPPPSNHSGFDL